MNGLAAGLGTVGVIFLLILVVLAFLMPFFIYGTNMRTKETALALMRTNSLLADIHGELTYMKKQSDELTYMKKQSEKTAKLAGNPNTPPKDIKPKTNQDNKSKSNRLFPADTFTSEEEQLDTDSGPKYRACPKCKSNNPLDAAVCRCGHALNSPK
jgi:hypothetical protein